MRGRMWSWRGWLLSVLVALAAAGAAPAAAAPRLALVIGNAAYPAQPLATGANDAGLVAQALAQVGFDVTAAHDLDLADLRSTLRAFADAARAAGPDVVIAVYAAGYGVQYGGDNYLVPTDARIAHDGDVPTEAADLDDLTRALQGAPAKARLVVYDLARANAFAGGDEMPLAPGLAMVTPGTDTIVAFAAAPGVVAPADAPPYGAYARALAEMIGTPGLPVNALFETLRLRVGELTDGAQVPWDVGSIDDDDLALAPGSNGRPAKPARAIDAIPVDALSPDIAYSAVIARDSLAAYADFVRAFPGGPLSDRVRALLAARREAMTARDALASDDPRADWTYLRRYPRGPHRFDARRRLAALHAALEPPPRFEIAPFPNVPPPPTDEPGLLGQLTDVGRGLPPIPPVPEALLPRPNPAFYDDLPPPAPVPTGLLPVAAPLPQVEPAAATGRIVQDALPGPRLILSRTTLVPGTGATLTLTSGNGLVARLTTSYGPGRARTIVETGPGKAVLARTTTVGTATGLVTVQTGASGGVVIKIAAETEPTGERATRVADGRDDTLALWRRDGQGIVVERKIFGAGPAQDARLPAPKPAPAAPAPKSEPIPPPPAPTAPAAATAAPPAAKQATVPPPSAPPAAASPPPRPSPDRLVVLPPLAPEEPAPPHPAVAPAATAAPAVPPPPAAASPAAPPARADRTASQADNGPMHPVPLPPRRPPTPRAKPKPAKGRASPAVARKPPAAAAHRQGQRRH